MSEIKGYELDQFFFIPLVIMQIFKNNVNLIIQEKFHDYF